MATAIITIHLASLSQRKNQLRSDKWSTLLNSLYSLFHHCRLFPGTTVQFQRDKPSGWELGCLLYIRSCYNEVTVAIRVQLAVSSENYQLNDNSLMREKRTFVNSARIYYSSLYSTLSLVRKFS